MGYTAQYSNTLFSGIKTQACLIPQPVWVVGQHTQSNSQLNLQKKEKHLWMDVCKHLDYNEPK